MVRFQWAVLSWVWGGLVAPGAGQERSHAAWRSFFSTTMLPMQRGARSGPRGCRQERSHAAWRSLFAKKMLLMQRGARSGWSWRGLGVILASIFDGNSSIFDPSSPKQIVNQTGKRTSKPTNSQSIKQTINQTNKQSNKQ